jgi:hypothetical protein
MIPTRPCQIGPYYLRTVSDVEFTSQFQKKENQYDQSTCCRVLFFLSHIPVEATGDNPMPPNFLSPPLVVSTVICRTAMLNLAHGAHSGQDFRDSLSASCLFIE